MVEALRRFEHIYLVLDGDTAGREATQRLLDELGPMAMPVTLVGVKDVAELAVRPDGAAYFSRSVAAAERALAA
jgi:DNA primase